MSLNMNLMQIKLQKAELIKYLSFLTIKKKTTENENVSKLGQVRAARRQLMLQKVAKQINRYKVKLLQQNWNT